MTRLRIIYRTEGKAPDEVALGAFAQIAAKRRYGLEVIQSEDAEPALFGVFVELVGPQKAAEDGAFDAWLMTVEDFDVIGKEEAPTPPPAETSSDLSPDSPPTSD